MNKMVVNLYECEYEIVKIDTKSYANNGNLAIQLYCKDKEYDMIEPFATLTVNLCKLNSENEAYIDTNNNPWAVDFIEKYNLGKNIGMTYQSGYCTYPLYEMNIEELAKYKEVSK